jgi:hypothetical protein
MILLTIPLIVLPLYIIFPIAAIAMMSDILLEHTRPHEDANYNVVKERV